MEIRFLTKQLQLMANIAREYRTRVDDRDWQHLHDLIIEKQCYLHGTIAAGLKESQKVKAEQALQTMSELFNKIVLDHGTGAKSA